MTPQEAIKIIEIAIAEVEWEYPMDYAVAFETALNALKKQIPKKPTDICTPVVTWGLCPVCKGELSKFKDRPNRVLEGNSYCPDCGQAIDWSDN